MTHTNPEEKNIIRVDRMNYECTQLSDFCVYIIIVLSSETLQGFFIHYISIVEEFHGRSAVNVLR